MFGCGFPVPYSRCLASLLLLPLVVACTQTPTKPSRKSAKPQIQAAEVVEHLTLAQLAYAKDDEAAAAANLEVVQSYHAKTGKGAKASVRQAVVVMECKGEKQKWLAPFKAGGAEREKTLGVLAQLSAKPCVLYNVWPATVTVVRDPKLKINSAAAAREQYGAMVQSAERYAPLERAKTQMQLTRVFLDARQRDAAYLAVEDAKQSLAAAEQTSTDKDATAALLKELLALEAELHKAMPFTL